MIDSPSVDPESVTSLFRTRVGLGLTPGAYFVAFDADGILFEGGYGQRHTGGGAAPDSQTRFRIASCTKSFTAATLLLMRDRGDIQLDSPVTEIVPELRPTLPKAQPVAPTIRMLMSMSSGLPTDDPWADRQESISAEDFAKILRAGVCFETIPGTAFEYSNLGYALLGQVIERITGQAYHEVVTEQLLDPLGLRSIVFDSTVLRSDETAIGYRKQADNWVEQPFSGPGAFSAIGGAFASASDLARWAQWLASAFDPAASDTGPLSAASRREMQQIHRATLPETEGRNPRGYGFGLFIEEDPIWGPTVSHSGGYPGFSSHMRWNLASGLGVIACENATYSGAWTPAVQALQLMLDHRKPQPRVVPSEEAAELGAQAQSLIDAWDDGLANQIFASNVAQDIPYREREAAIDELRAEVGALDPVPDTGVEFTAITPGRLVWSRSAAWGKLRCEIQLSPTVPAKVQSLTVSKELAE
jgi:CubicO group peptidase (beta-lactamase class C family)